jgi:ATP-dependent exoDNAse (exonuclease V) alpha subunit
LASYRFSVGIMKRSAGQCAVAGAAYRAGADLVDERTQQRADYTRRRGVVHSEIMAPDNAPAWMRDREALWNAVEKAEKRGDAQLAREVQLSLPHELTAAQRLELVRSFAREQFVAKGMIADIAIHAPGREGDDRNHHAHIMLSMRELTAEGFGKKARDWNDKTNIERWRAEWAHHQNREFDRLGLDARVDHRSFEARGIDREPEAHQGPAATAMERRGESSRIAGENEQRRASNARQADRHAEALRLRLEIDRERGRFEQWAVTKTAELEAAQALGRLDQTRRHELERDRLNDELEDFYGPGIRTVEAEAAAVQSRLQARGVRALWRNVSGRQAADRERLEKLEATAADARQRIDEARGKLERQQEAERERLAELQAGRRQEQQEGIARARERKEQSLAAAQDRAAQREAQARANDNAPRDFHAERRERAKRAQEADRGAQTPAEGSDNRERHEEARSQETASQRARETREQATPETQSKQDFFAELDAARERERQKDREDRQARQEAGQAKAADHDTAADPEAARREWARQEAERIRQRISDKGKDRDGPEFER